MGKSKKINYLLIIIILISTISIIYTNYIFSKQIVLEINNQILENEYKKLGGKDNYVLMKELQKQEMLGYIEKLKKEKPELIEKLKKNAEEKNTEEVDGVAVENKLPMDFISELKDDTYIKGSTGALITIVEFSDMECPYCIDFHKKSITNSLFEKYGEKINYVFKNFPLPTHKNAKKEAEAAMCIKSLLGGDKYLEFIDEIFVNTKGGGEGFDLSNLGLAAEKVGVEKIKFEECYNNETYKKEVEEEFKEGIKIGIKAVPSNILINNETGEFKLLTENLELSDFEEIIDDLIVE